MFRRCPLCQKEGLLHLNLKAFHIVRPGSELEVVCENEHYQHLKIGGVEFLAHTPVNMSEEERKSRMALEKEENLIALN